MADRSAGFSQPEPGRTSVSPLRALALTLLLLGILIATWLLTQNDPALTPTTQTPVTSTTLTNDEAIARLSELDQRRIQALEQGNAEILRDVFVADSPGQREVSSSIKKLVDDGVEFHQVRFDVRSVEVLSSTESEIRIRQVVISEIRFEKYNGKDVTTGSPVNRQVLVATLKLDGDRWLLYEGQLQRQTPVDE